MSCTALCMISPMIFPIRMWVCPSMRRYYYEEQGGSFGMVLAELVDDTRDCDKGAP